MIHRRNKRSSYKSKSKSRGGSMVSRLAVPASFLVLQKFMHSRKHKNHHHKKYSHKKTKTNRKRRGTRRR